jgi:NCS1 nucleoside transporter family
MSENTNPRTESRTGKVSEFGIEQVTPEARTYGFADTFFTWFVSGINTGSWYFGGLAAALGMAFVLESSLIWLPLIMLPWAAIGYIGYKYGASTVAASRPSLGVRGSSITGVLQTIVGGCWPSVNSFIAAISLTYVFQAGFGWAHYGQNGALWPMVFAILITGVAQGVLSTIGHEAIRYFERVAAILLIVLGIWMTVIVFRQWDIGQIFSFEGSAGQTPMQLIDYAFGFCWSWVMIADFARFAKTKKTSVVSTWLGINVGQAWFIIVGAIGVIGVALASGHLDPETSDPSSTLAELGLGLVAFFILVFATVSTNVTNLYGAGIGLINLVHGKKPRVALAYVAVGQLILCFAPLLFASFLDYFMTFLSFVGGLFVPLWTLIVVDYFLVRRRRVVESALFDLTGGDYWYQAGWNWRGIAAFVSGVIVYFVVTLGFPDVEAIATASLPAIAVTAIIYLAASRIRHKWWLVQPAENAAFAASHEHTLGQADKTMPRKQR